MTTRAETAKILISLQAAYPDTSKGLPDDVLQAMITLWYKAFEGESYETVSKVVLAHVSADTGRFMPPIGVIKDRLLKLQNPAAMTEAEAWNLVLKAMRNSGYHAKEEFDKLPPVLQRLVGSPSQLRTWSMMDFEVVNSVVSSNFKRSYRERAEQIRNYAALPPSIQRVVGQLSEKMTMPALEEAEKGEPHET